jgi:signal transduction histidine kinase/CheY-like chemotaxis protein
MKRTQTGQVWETQDYELMRSTSQKIITTVSATYLVFHFILTLGWPQIFSPRLWICTLLMGLTTALCFSLLQKHFLVAQLTWFTGLLIVLYTAFYYFARPEIIFLLIFFPMMAEVMVGLKPALIMEGLILGLIFFWEKIPFLTPLPENYYLSLGMLSVATTTLGWSLSHNLISAIESSGYHYHEALRNLEEARQHRAEISSLLNEVNKANYQLERLNTMLSFARARAEEAHEERSRFTMAVSHELRSPLNFIIGFSDLMVNSPETYGDLREWPAGLYEDIQEIYRSSDHLMGLINDILEMGKIDARQMTLFREKISLETIFTAVYDMVEAAVKKKNLNLDLELEPDLPLIYVDETRIRQVLLNLVTNALRFTDRGKIKMSGRLKDHNQIEIEVSDTGAGIAPEDLKKIFHEFRQVGNQNWQRSEGTGLGLAIGRRFILMHGGDMSVESRPGKGSVFRFTLPVRTEDEEVEIISTSRGLLNPEQFTSDDEEQLAARRLFEQKESNRSPMLVFLAEDLFWARIFAELMTEYKINLLSDSSRLDAVIRQVYPRAVIIDQALVNDPHVQALVANPPYEIPIIAFPIPINLNRVTSLPEGVNRYLIKPVSRQTLLEAVNSVGVRLKTILVVDDDPAMVRFVVQSLKGQADPSSTSGVKNDDQEAEDPLTQLDAAETNFLTAYNAAEALSRLKSEEVNLILLDLELPDMNGLVLIEKLREDETLNRIPIIIISANDLPQVLSSNQHSTYQVMINRPFQRSELADILKSTIKDLLPVYGLGENEVESVADHTSAEEQKAQNVPHRVKKTIEVK